MDYEVSRKVWESQVPVQFTMQSGGPLGDPLPFYTMLPRFSYLALALPKALSSFNRREEGEKIHVDKVWLETNGTPVKMYIPIGVIYDQANLTENESILEISVRTSQPPTEFQMVDRDMMEAMFTQTVKEADYLKTKAAITNSMQKEESSQLWKSVSNNNFDEFWTIIQKFMETKDNNEFISVPLRVYVKNQPYKQILITSKHKDGSLRTIGEAVSEVLKTCSTSSSSQSSESSTPTSESSSLSPIGGEERRLISHGIDIPTHTPLIFAAKNLSYPDNFVHIVVITSPSSSSSN